MRCVVLNILTLEVNLWSCRCRNCLHDGYTRLENLLGKSTFQTDVFEFLLEILGSKQIDPTLLENKIAQLNGRPL